MLCHAHHGFEAAVHILVRSRPIADADAHRRTALPHCATTPARALLLDCGDRALCALGISERDEHLIQRYFIQYLETGASQSIGEAAGGPAVRLAALGQAPSAQRT